MNEINQLENAKLNYPFVAQVPASRAGATASDSAGSVATGPFYDYHAADVDSVEFSTTGTQLAQLKEEPAAIRFDKVAQIRSEIQNGTYDVDSKLASIIHRVIDDVIG